MKQLSLRFELATRRTRRALEQRRRSLIADAENRRALHDSSLRLRRRGELDQEKVLFADFQDRYDSLIGLLCLAAQDGNTPETEAEFREQRAWFMTHYAEVKRTLGLHIEADDSDTLPGRFGRRTCDAFEALFHPPTLNSLLTHDGGNLIGRMMRTQNALEARKDALRRQEVALVQVARQD